MARLSGRQVDRKRNGRGYTEPMLLAGLMVLVPTLILLETMSLEEVRAAAAPLLELIPQKPDPPPPKRDTRVV